MARGTVLALAAGLLGISAAAAREYVSTPAGMMRAECVHAVPSGSHVEHTDADTHFKVTTPTGEVRHLLKCKDSAEQPILRGASSRRLQLPPDYDGWLEYNAYYDADGFDAFLGDFSVPDLPTADPQVLYLFTGLQNIDWIPKVDPEPSQPFDIIQPVLQFPADDGSGWSVKSWYVTLNAGAVYSNELDVSPGDAIFGNMTRTGDQKWFIGSTSVKHGTSTTISADHPRLKTQPWAYNTLECYGCQGCSTYPQKPCKFTKLQLFKTGMKPVTPTWKNNPKPAQDRKCHESIAIESPSAVTIGFQS